VEVEDRGEQMDRVRAFALQLRDFLMALPPARRMRFLGLAAAALAVTIGLTLWAQIPSYKPLVGRLDPGDAAGIVDLLKSENVPYRLAEGGATIEVPSDRLHETRILLAGRGLPQGGGGVGFELFDRQTLGMTDFVQRLGYQRALQGELARTIGSLAAVESARVHLALPERSLFVADERRPSASVVLKVRAGRSLAPDQVQGIVNLVASSVEGLRAGDVTVVDTTGAVLSARGNDAGERGPAEGLRAYQREIEHAYVQRIETMLERVLGPGQAVARVTATLDLAEVEKTEEIVDPDRVAIKSERRNAETNRQGAAGGTPGVSGTLTNDPNAAAPTDGPHSEHSDAVLSYEVSRVTSRRIEPRGGLSKLSVAVLIDGVPEGEGTSRQIVPRSKDEVERYKELVKRVVGFDASRGDEIEVVSAPFTNPDAEPASPPGILERLGSWSDALWRAAGLGLALIVALAVIRPFLLAMVSRAPVAPASPATARIEIPSRPGIGEHLVEAARRNPEQTALVIKQWMNGAPS
jgi:flagellar M-ring protein FliF